MTTAWISRRRIMRPMPGAAAVFAAAVAAAQGTDGMLEWPPEGTVVTIERVVSGSHGPAGANFGSTGGRVSWTFEKRDWKGRPVIAAAGEGANSFLYDRADGGLIAVLDPAGKLLLTYDPPVRTEWPLEVGKTWTSATRMTEESYGSKPVVPEQFSFRVEAKEDVTVPAGTFKAYKLSWSVLGSSSVRWVVPALGLVGDFSVKGSDERRSGTLLGPGRREWVLVSRTQPKP